MKIILNGKETEAPGGAVVADIIKTLKIDGPVAAQVNEEIIHREKFDEVKLKQGDVVEIFAMMGGG